MLGSLRMFVNTRSEQGLCCSAAAIGQVCGGVKVSGV